MFHPMQDGIDCAFLPLEHILGIVSKPLDDLVSIRRLRVKRRQNKKRRGSRHEFFFASHISSLYLEQPGILYLVVQGIARGSGRRDLRWQGKHMEPNTITFLSQQQFEFPHVGAVVARRLSFGAPASGELHPPRQPIGLHPLQRHTRAVRIARLAFPK